MLALAKVVSLGVTAFIFDLTRDKLLLMPSFRWLYDLGQGKHAESGKPMAARQQPQTKNFMGKSIATALRTGRARPAGATGLTPNPASLIARSGMRCTSQARQASHSQASNRKSAPAG